MPETQQPLGRFEYTQYCTSEHCDGCASLAFADGEIEVCEAGANNDVSMDKEETRQLYEAMKAYYGDAVIRCDGCGEQAALSKPARPSHNQPSYNLCFDCLGNIDCERKALLNAIDRENGDCEEFPSNEIGTVQDCGASEHAMDAVCIPQLMPDAKYNTKCTASNCLKDCKKCQARCMFRIFQYEERPKMRQGQRITNE